MYEICYMSAVFVWGLNFMLNKWRLHWINSDTLDHIMLIKSIFNI